MAVGVKPKRFLFTVDAIDVLIDWRHDCSFSQPGSVVRVLCHVVEDGMLEFFLIGGRTTECGRNVHNVWKLSHCDASIANLQ